MGAPVLGSRDETAVRDLEGRKKNRKLQASIYVAQRGSGVLVIYEPDVHYGRGKKVNWCKGENSGDGVVRRNKGEKSRDLRQRMIPFTRKEKGQTLGDQPFTAGGGKKV